MANPVQVKPDIHWVGGIDWDLRNFHGYITQRGSTYNAYLILDEKKVLVDTVKHYLFDEMLSRIKKLIDPSTIDYIVTNHAEMDHSGSLPKILELIPQAKIIVSPQGEKSVRYHFKKDWNFWVVKTGDSIKIGKRTLEFYLTPMVHWPDSMATYIPEEKLLLPNDAFGQHIASFERFDDELGWDILHEEAAKYYGNIVLPYGDQVKKALDALSTLDIEMIAPSHGLIWRSYLPKILEAYTKWAAFESEKRALIVYDTMWGSTEKMAYALREGLEESGIPVVMRCLKTTDISDVMTDVLFSKAILVGSPTLNNGIFPKVSAFLTYLKGLRPRRRIGFAFGSYGWGGKVVSEIEEILRGIGWEIPYEGAKIRYVPDESDLDRLKETGRNIGDTVKG